MMNAQFNHIAAGACSAANTKAERRTPFDAANDVEKRLTILRGRLLGLADRLVGAEPSNDKNPCPPAAGGVFGALGVSADNALADIHACHSALDRIERELP